MSLTSQLLQLQADAHALWLRFHNYHWNVKGLQFAQLHEYTEGAYEKMAAIFDEAAERVQMKGERANVCATALSQLAKLPEMKATTFSATELLGYLRADYEHLLASFAAINKSAEAEGDYSAAAWAQERMASLEKELWFIGNMLA